MGQILKFKRGNSSRLDSLTLAAGEPAFVVDNGKLYIGDGLKKVLINPDVAQTAEKLLNKRKFCVTGDGTTSTVEFNGEEDVTLLFSLVNSGVPAGTFTKLTVNSKGIVTGASQLTSSDIPNLTLAKISDAGTAAKVNIGSSAGNVPVLNSKGELDEKVLPTLSITDVFEADSQSAMLNISGANKGDICVRTDISKSFILKCLPINVLANWVELRTPVDNTIDGGTF